MLLRVAWQVAVSLSKISHEWTALPYRYTLPLLQSYLGSARNLVSSSIVAPFLLMMARLLLDLFSCFLLCSSSSMYVVHAMVLDSFFFWLQVVIWLLFRRHCGIGVHPAIPVVRLNGTNRIRCHTSHPRAARKKKKKDKKKTRFKFNGGPMKLFKRHPSHRHVASRGEEGGSVTLHVHQTRSG